MPTLSQWELPLKYRPAPTSPHHPLIIDPLTPLPQTTIPLPSLLPHRPPYTQARVYVDKAITSNITINRIRATYHHHRPANRSIIPRRTDCHIHNHHRQLLVMFLSDKIRGQLYHGPRRSGAWTWWLTERQCDIGVMLCLV